LGCRSLQCATLLALLTVGCASEGRDEPGGSAALQPVTATDAVSVDADDPAVWLNPADAGQSLVIGTNKVTAPQGALVVFDLAGRTRQTIAGIDRPNNVDVEYGLPLAGRSTDIVVTTERLQHQLRVFAVSADPVAPLTEVTTASGIQVLSGETGLAAEPMGIALYKRPRDGAMFAIVAPRISEDGKYLWQYRLEDDGRGKVKGTFVRRFGRFTGAAVGPEADNQIEAVAVDDALGYVYYAEEDYGIRKAHADPDHPEASADLALFGQAGFAGDREGVAIYARPDGTGYIVCSDQLPDGTVFHLFAREGSAGKPHEHLEIAAISSTADSSDGIEVVATPMPPRFPHGLLIAMNSRGHNFLLYRWEDIASAAPALTKNEERRTKN
jgi:3-phytase